MLRLRREWDRIRTSSLVRNAGWMFCGQGLSVVCQAMYFMLLARLLGSTEYGIYVGAFAMVSILSVYSQLGSAFVLVRYASADHSKFKPYWGNVLATTVILGSIFVILLTWGIPHIARTYSWKLVLCVALADCLGAQLVDGASRVFLLFEKMRYTASLGLLANLMRLLLAGIMLWRFHCITAEQWVLAVLAVSILSAAASLLLVTYHYGRPTFSFDLFHRRIGEGFIFALSSSTFALYNNLDKAMLGHYGMNAANGVYSMAYRVVDISTMPITSIHQAASPRFFRKGVDGILETAPYARQIVKRTAPLAVVMALLMFVCAPLIPHLVGSSFSQSTMALRWLCLIPIFRSLHLSSGDALTTAGYLKLRLSLQGGAAAFNFGVNLYLIPHYGWLGAAWSSLATDGLLAVFTVSICTSIQARARIGAMQVKEKMR